MTQRPSPTTPYELKLRLKQEQAFYDRFGASTDQTRPLLAPLAEAVANLLESASHAVRALAAPHGDRHAH